MAPRKLREEQPSMETTDENASQSNTKSNEEALVEQESTSDKQTLT